MALGYRRKPDFTARAVRRSLGARVELGLRDIGIE